MTECSSVLTFLTDEDHRAGGPRLRSAGRPLIGVDLTIHDEDGEVVATGRDGEVCARAGNFMREYWNRPEETDEAFRDGWYHTGDVGHLDADGYLYLVDRVKDMIVTGGENVYSIEVENAISTHPAVDQVAVIGIPHPTWGEQVHAIVVLHPGCEATGEELQAARPQDDRRLQGPEVDRVPHRADPAVGRAQAAQASSCGAPTGSTRSTSTCRWAAEPGGQTDRGSRERPSPGNAASRSGRRAAGPCPAMASTSSKPSARHVISTSASGTAASSIVTPTAHVPSYDRSVAFNEAPIVGPNDTKPSTCAPAR